MTDTLTAAVLERLPDDSAIRQLPDPAAAVSDVLTAARSIGAVHDADAEARAATIDELCEEVAVASRLGRYVPGLQLPYGPRSILRSPETLDHAMNAALRNASGMTEETTRLNRIKSILAAEITRRATESAHAGTPPATAGDA